MTDRELLELAAKAAGIKGEYVEENRMVRDSCSEQKQYIKTSNEQWNPLTDDGQAFTLAVNLRMAMYHYSYKNHPGEFMIMVDIFNPILRIAEVFQLESERQSSVRRAIVRAAAEIAKKAKGQV